MNRIASESPATPALPPSRSTSCASPGDVQAAPPRESERSVAPGLTGAAISVPSTVEGPSDAVRDKALEILREAYGPGPGSPASPPPRPAEPPPSKPEVIPARMLNEFVYCPRLFYYEFVESVFVENADTVRGTSIHRRVNAGAGALPAAKVPAGQEGVPAAPPAAGSEPETIHSRSVSMGSEGLGVTVKMDLVEVRREGAELFDALQVCPVEYKAGSPREGAEGNELWDTDRMQLGLQALILRENGYACDEGVVYYRGTRQRVRLAITADLEVWVRGRLDEARRVAQGPIPPPLNGSPKCPRCSLAPVCLPDETRLLAHETSEPPREKPEAAADVRRLMAARDDRRALYLTTPGLRVGRKDELLEVKEGDRVLDQVRVNDVCHVALFGNIQISTQAVQLLCGAEVPLSYFSMGGWFYGITRGHGLKNVFLRMAQFESARDVAVCLGLARRFVHGKIRNHRTLMMRNHVDAPAPALARLRQAAEEALEARNLEELLGMEGAAASVYFEHFAGLLKPADDLPPAADEAANKPGQPPLTFSFAGRNRRPPTDPVNALLSLAYSLLAKDCTLAALAVGFDPYVGFYHQPRFGRPALALDLMEEFRPLVAESAVLSCVNNRVITERDFVRAGEAVNLSPAGRKRFFQTYEQRMTSLLTHPVFDYKVSYRRALELQARLLARVLTGEIAEYQPLMTR